MVQKQRMVVAIFDLIWMKSFYRKYLWNLKFMKLLGIIGSLKLKKEVLKCHTIEDYIDLAYSFHIFFIPFLRPRQVKEEINELLNFLVRIKPKVICEIGTAGGGTFFLLSKISSPDAYMISIDLPGGIFGGGYPKWKIPFYKSFATGDQKIFLIRENSHNPKTVLKLKRILGQRKLDFLFIDGDPTYKGVKKDFQMYGKLVRKGGFVAFHDIIPGPTECVGGVPKFWKEIRKKFKYREIFKSREQGGHGIGILYKNIKQVNSKRFKNSL